MESRASRVARAELGTGGVWVYLPDRCCLVPMQFATRLLNATGEGCISPPRCDSPPRNSQIHFRPPCTSPPPCYGPLKRGLSESEIADRLSSSTGEMFSPETKVATPETPSASAEYKDEMNAKRRRLDAKIEPVNVPCLEPVNVPEPIQECKHDATTA